VLVWKVDLLWFLIVPVKAATLHDWSMISKFVSFSRCVTFIWGKIKPGYQHAIPFEKLYHKNRYKNYDSLVFIPSRCTLLNTVWCGRENWMSGSPIHCVLTEKGNTLGWIQETWSWQQGSRSPYWWERSYDVVWREDGQTVCPGTTGTQRNNNNNNNNNNNTLIYIAPACRMTSEA